MGRHPDAGTRWDRLKFKKQEVTRRMMTVLFARRRFFRTDAIFNGVGFGPMGSLQCTWRRSADRGASAMQRRFSISAPTPMPSLVS